MSHRPVAVRGLASCVLLVRLCGRARCPIAPSPCAAWHRASSSCAFAVGRDVPIAPPRHGAVRGLASRAHSSPVAYAPLVRLGIPHPFVFPRRRPSSRITRAARCSAAGPPGSRRHLPTRITRAARWGHRALPPLRPISPPTSLPPIACSTLVSRCGRTRCLAATARGGSPPPPARASRLLPVAARHRRAAWHPAPSRHLKIEKPVFAFLLHLWQDSPIAVALGNTPVFFKMNRCKAKIANDRIDIEEMIT